MQLRPYCLAALVALAAAPLSAQNLVQRTLQNDTMPNLVPNPGFEEYAKPFCGWTQNVEKFNTNVVGWNSPTQTTPDLYSTKNDPDCWGHPNKHSSGKQSTRTGHGMAGIKIYGKGNTPTYWHEYLQIELPEPLQAGVRYIAECWVLRAVRSNEASNNIGLLLTDKAVSTRDCLPLYITPTVNEDKVVKKGTWHKVSGVFEATGNERFLLIGNFYGDEVTTNEKMPDGERGAYYYIDDVNVRIAPPGMALSPKPRASNPPPPRPVPPPHASSNSVDIHAIEPAVGTRMRLDNVQFEFDKATLLPGYEKELNKLVDLMTDFPFLRVEIGGHTDDQGSDAYNDKLSNDRAKAVADYLMKKKIAADRITWKGYGKRQPLVPNTSEENRATNRRVEFQVLER
ncbi:MAG: OmpA family protein [Flavobacteriales bacterium]|nr:OmpA family protein [Flavobacteriales bacterium]